MIFGPPEIRIRGRVSARQKQLGEQLAHPTRWQGRPVHRLDGAPILTFGSILQSRNPLWAGTDPSGTGTAPRSARIEAEHVIR
jgi:hypothetical protein